jgi:pimeloyl-ACP methyl ester carboxylesterase
VRNVLERRFGSRWSAVEFDLVSNYLYHISAAPALGEYSLNSILEVVSSNAYVNKPRSTIKSLPDAKPDAAETSGKEVASSTYKTFIYAREPLSKKLHELPKTIPVLVLFGDDDWMYNPAEVINQNIKDLQTGSGYSTLCAPGASTSSPVNIPTNEGIGSSTLCAPSASTSSPVNIPGNEGIDITLQIIPNAGHHIYLDNAKDFNDSMAQWVTQKGF